MHSYFANLYEIESASQHYHRTLENINIWESNFLSHIPSQVAMLAAMYSTSVELNATNFCFLLNQETTPDPMLKQEPEVIFRSSTHPTQSTSVKPANCTLSLHS